MFLDILGISLDHCQVVLLDQRISDLLPRFLELKVVWTGISLAKHGQTNGCCNEDGPKQMLNLFEGSLLRQRESSLVSKSNLPRVVTGHSGVYLPRVVRTD